MKLRERLRNRFLPTLATATENPHAEPPALVTPAEAETIEPTNIKQQFVSSLKSSIASRKARSTPLFEFITEGNRSFERGWLRNGLVDSETSSRSQIRPHENKLILFIFMGLSGTGEADISTKSVDETTPIALLAIAWGFSKPSIRRVCGAALDDNFVDNMLKDENDVDVSNKRRINTSWTPRAKYADSDVDDVQDDSFQLSPDVAAARTRKRLDTKATPTIVSALESISLESPKTPTNVMRFFGRPGSELQRRTRLQFGSSTPAVEEIDDTESTTVETLRVDAGTQTEMKSRLEAEIKQQSISRDCEEEICRALFLLFRNKSESTKEKRAPLTEDGEILTVRQFRKGSSLKILRIKEHRQSTKGDFRGRKLKRKIRLVETLLANLDAPESEIVSILKKVGKNHSVRVFSDEECCLSVQHCAALMQYLPLTARGLERLSKFFRAVLPTFSETLFPSLLRKKVASYAMESFNLRLGFELVSLEIGGEKRNDRCLHVWIKEPAVAIESLTQSAIVAGKFEDSIVFSRHMNELIVVQGSDRGGDITTCLVRIANRNGGNASQYCIPLACYEFGKESYTNLRKTIFNPGKPTKEFLQRMLNDCYQMIVVTAHDSNNTPVDCQCRLVHVESELRINDHLSDIDNLRLEQPETELPNTISILDDAETLQLGEGQCGHKVDVRLVTKTADQQTTCTYQGFVLTNCFGRDVVHARFTELLHCPSGGIVTVLCLRIRCITSDDIKCNTALMGQGTATVMCPCTVCISTKKDFGKYLTLPMTQQPPLREGDNANPVLYRSFVEAAGGRADWVRATSTGQARTLKLRYKSVVHQPLLYTPPDHNSCSGMHVSSGLLTHCTTKMLEVLGEIDRMLPWLDTLQSLLSEAKDFITTAAKVGDGLRKQDAALERDANQALKLSMTNEVANIREERRKLSLELTANTKATEAAKLFLEKGKDFLDGAVKKTKCRIIGPATYCFRKAYEVDGRVFFRVENSGFELSNGDGIRVLERRELIAKRMNELFRDKPNLQTMVRQVMESFIGLTSLLYEISKMLKTQKKWTNDDVSRFDSITLQYAEKWLAFLRRDDTDGEDSNVFNKLHVVRSHLPKFAERSLMLGRCSEEGFESSHKCIESIRQPLVCMTSTEARAYTIFRRIMLQCRPEVEAIRRQIEESFVGQKRAPYKKNSQALKSQDDAPCASNQQEYNLAQGFTHSINGYVIKEEWKEYFEYVCFSKVPPSWSKLFTQDESLGGVFRAKVEYV